MDRPGTQPRWWHGATLYQVYVRSWRDTNGDGYGDLRGVTAQLDYLSWLGVDGIWLSPTMPSPDDDWGYDVSDYLGVHPELGTLADLDLLIAEAGQRDMRVLLDLVPNHTSSAHPWFVEAVSGPGRAAPRLLRMGRPGAGGGPPNNWLDATGRARLDPGRGQRPVLPAQLPAQPARPELVGPRRARGIPARSCGSGSTGAWPGSASTSHTGLYKDAQLRDDPPAPEGRLVDRPVRPGPGVQRQPAGVARGVPGLARRSPRAIRRRGCCSARPGSATWPGWPPSTASGDELQLTFNFPFIFAAVHRRGACPQVVAETLAKLPAGECPVWTASNHDISRFPTRWCGGDERKARLALLVLATLPGTLVLYYGDEIGMTDVAVPAGSWSATRCGPGRAAR